MGSITFQQHVAHLEHRCREDIAEASVDPTTFDEIDNDAIEAALRANASPRFKPNLQGRARRAAGVLKAIAGVREALDDEDAELATVRAVSVGYLVMEGMAHEQFIDFRTWLRRSKEADADAAPGESG